MISAISLLDKDGIPSVFHETANRIVTYQEGLYGMSQLRSVKRPRPTGHGTLNDSRYTDGHLILLRGDIYASTPELTLADFHSLVTPCQDTLDSGAALMKWTEGSAGLQLQRLVKYEAGMDPPADGASGSLIQYEAQFFAEDPRAYSQTLQTVSSSALSTASGGLVFPMRFPFRFTPSGGGTVAVTNSGNRKTPPVFRIYGMCVNPAIVNVTTGERITISGTIANGDYLEVGTDSNGQRYAKLNGSTLQNNFIDSANTTWFDLDRGTTNLQLIAGTFDGTARLDVLFRDAYA